MNFPVSVLGKREIKAKGEDILLTTIAIIGLGLIVFELFLQVQYERQRFRDSQKTVLIRRIRFRGQFLDQMFLTNPETGQGEMFVLKTRDNGSWYPELFRERNWEDYRDMELAEQLGQECAANGSHYTKPEAFPAANRMRPSTPLSDLLQRMIRTSKLASALLHQSR